MSFSTAMLQVLAATIATYSAGILFRSRNKELILSAILGGAGWGVYLLVLNHGSSSFMATFMASIFISAISLTLSRICKTPVIAFQIIAIFAIVPGAGMYHTLYAAVISDYAGAISYFFSTMQTAAAIALGILIVNAFNPLVPLDRLMRHNHLRK